MIDWSSRRAAARAFVEAGLGKAKEWARLSYAYDYQEGDMLYLHCYDADPKRSASQRLASVVEAYTARFGVQPDIILVNEIDAGATYPGVEIKAEKRIGPNNYQAGKQGE
jgi:hypothetical protein